MVNVPYHTNTMTEYYYLNSRNEPQGPHSLDELTSLMSEGRINPTTLVACKGATSWEPLGNILSRENIEPPVVTVSPGQIGTCPSCSQDLAAASTDGLLPIACPACGRALRPARPGIWANFRLAISNYFKISGRATRAEYWCFQLVNFIVIFALYAVMFAGMATGLIVRQLDEEGTEQAAEQVIDTAIGSGSIIIGLAVLLSSLAIILWSLFVLIPNITVTVRRLHDVGWSGWWILGYLLFCIFTQMPLFLLEASPENEPATALMVAFGLLWLLTFAYGIFMLVLMVLDSKRGSNAYGPSPKYPLG